MKIDIFEKGVRKNEYHLSACVCWPHFLNGDASLLVRDAILETPT